jgi:methyl-accepting chemotaxis protein
MSMNKFNNVRTLWKISLAFLLPLCASAAVTVATWLVTNRLEASAGWTEHTYKVIRQVDALVASMVDRETGIRGYLLSADPRFLEPLRNGEQTYTRTLADVRGLTADNPAQQGRFVELDSLVGKWKQDVSDRITAILQDPAKIDEARKVEISGTGKAFMDGIRAKANEIVNVEAALLDVRSAASASAATFARTAMIGGAAIIAALIAAFLVILNMSLVRPMVQLSNTMKAVAAGENATVPGTERRDEIGEIAKAFEENAERIANLANEQRRKDEQTAADQRQRDEQAVAEQRKRDEQAEAERKALMHKLADDFETAVGNIIEGVSTAATELEAAANTLTNTADTTQQLSTVVASASEEASANVQSVAGATEEMTGSISEISRQVQESSTISNEAVEQARKTDARINELSKAASRIGDVINLITAIAEQTNLLALNATIEAARAGEAGKGFAVVAQEVKALAAQTAKATGEIGTQIAEMQTATNESVAAIEEISGTISRISHISSAIAAAVEEQGAATAEIARNVQEAAKGTAQVATNIVDVNHGAGATGSASSQVLASAQSLASESNHLKAEVGKFMATVRAA